MSLLVVILVALGVYLYVRSMRVSRRNWLQRIDLIGTWRCDEDGITLKFAGQLDAGRYQWHETAAQAQDGTWRLVGHTLLLRSSDGEREFDLSFFKPGHIGLEDTAKKRRVFTKATDNVVELRKRGPQNGAN